MSRYIVRVLLIVSLTTPILAGATEAPSPIRLKDGSYIFIDPEGTTRMVDAYGQPIKMRDGQEMITVDGEVILMHNNRAWKQVGPPGKRRQVSTPD